MAKTNQLTASTFKLPPLTPEELEAIESTLETNGKCHISFKYGRYSIFKSIPKGCHWVTIGGERLPTIAEALAELNRLCHLETLTRNKRQAKLKNERS